MNAPIALLALVGFTTAFTAVIISASFKRFLVPKHPDTFRQTLKYGLLGGLVGLIVFVILWVLKRQETNSWATPGAIGMIPFYFMLIGQLLGVYLPNRIKK